MNRILFLISLTFLIFACKNPEETSIKNYNNEPVLEDEERTGTVTKEDISIITFDQLQNEILNIQNQTLYVVNFWATWCKPCVKELPAFELIGERYKDQGVKVILVSLDFPEHLEKGVIPFIEKYGLKSEIVILDDTDSNTWIPLVSKEWSGAIPATLLISNGERNFFEQSFTYDSLEKEIKKILKA